MAEMTVPTRLPALREKYPLAGDEEDRLLSSLYVSRPIPGVTGTPDPLAGSSGGRILVASERASSFISMAGYV